MALIKCKECGHEVSSTAATCPNCGAKVAKPMGCGSLVGIALLIVIIVAVLGSNDQTPSISTSSESTNGAGVNAQPQAPPQPGSQWHYSHSEDAMGKGAEHHALVQSSNVVDFSFPYHGPQHATLTLRTHPRHGKDVIFRIEKGQLLCSSYDGCTVLVRFDDGQGSNFSAMPAADNSTEILFITNYGRFVEKMLKAQRVRISANVYQEGAPVFDFDVSSFDLAKYKPSR